YRRWGRLDVLFNNARVIRLQPLREVTEPAWDRVLGINLKAVFFVLQAAARRMKEQPPMAVSELRGKLIQPASIAGYRGASPLLVTAAAWASMLWSPMDADEMAGAGMVMAPSVGGAVAFVGAWAVMMAAMMLPSALPMIGLYAATQRGAPSPAAKAAAIAAFVLMYLVVWAMTGLPIYFASVALMAVTSVTLAYAIAGVLVVAGFFQLSPLKQVCLRHCRSPLGFLLGHSRAGWRGAVAMGWAHAIYCLGCCWALMVVLVVA